MDEELLAKMKATLNAGRTSLSPTKSPGNVSESPTHGGSSFRGSEKRRQRDKRRARAQSEATGRSNATEHHGAPNASFSRPTNTRTRPRRSRSTRAPTGISRELSASHDPDLRFRRAVPLQKKSEPFHAVLGTGSSKPVASAASEKPRTLFSRRSATRGHRRSLSEPTARSIPSSSAPVASLPAVGKALSPPRTRKQLPSRNEHQQVYEHYLQLYQEQYGMPSQVTPPLSGSGIAPLSLNSPNADASQLQMSTPSSSTASQQQQQVRSPSSITAAKQLPSLASQSHAMRVAEEQLLVQATSPLRGPVSGPSSSSWAPPTRGPFAASWMRDLSAMSGGSTRRRRRSSGGTTTSAAGSSSHQHHHQHHQRSHHLFGSRPGSGDRDLDIRGLSLSGSSVGHANGGHVQQHPHPHLPSHLAPLDRSHHMVGGNSGVASSWDHSRDSSAARRNSITEHVFAKRRSSLPRVNSTKGGVSAASNDPELVIEPADFATLLA